VVSNVSTLLEGVYLFNVSFAGNQNYSPSYEAWNLTVFNQTVTPPSGGGAGLCRFRKFGYYNSRLPFLTEGGCV
jgi:hypothetical protein